MLAQWAAKLENPPMHSKAGTALAFALFTSSCGSASGHELVSSVAKQMTSYSSSLTSARKQVDAVLQALDGVQATAASDPRPSFASFVSGVRGLESGFDKLRDGSTSIQKGMKDYVDSWTHEITQMQNPDVRTQAEGRKKHITDLFAGVTTSMDEGAKAADGYLTHLTDVQKLLNNDLNPVGIAKSKQLLAQLREQGAKLIARQGEIAKQVDAFVKDFAPATAK